MTVPIVHAMPRFISIIVPDCYCPDFYEFLNGMKKREPSGEENFVEEKLRVLRNIVLFLNFFGGFRVDNFVDLSQKVDRTVEGKRITRERRKLKFVKKFFHTKPQRSQRKSFKKFKCFLSVASWLCVRHDF